MPDSTTAGRKRVLLAGLFHETHTFVEGKTTLADFEKRIGAELWDAKGDASPLDGVLQFAAEHDWEIVPSIDLRATPSAMADDEVVEFWWSKFSEDLEREHNNGNRLDSIFLLLHGAMVSQNFHDVEGELLRRIRNLSGVLLCGVTDLHANFSQAMADNSHALLTYRENPHTDARETAIRAATLMNELMQRKEKPVTLFAHPPIMWPPTGTGTADEPMKSLEKMARELEISQPDILAVNVHAGFSFADTPDTGVSFSIVAQRDTPAVREAMQELCAAAMKEKESGNIVSPNLEIVMPEVKKLIAKNQTPVLLVEPSDNVGGGAPGDDTAILRAFLENDIDNSAVIINDPVAVNLLFAFPIGATQRIAIGGDGSTLGAGPIELELEIISRSDGKFELEDAHSHMASIYGSHIEMGHCVVAKSGGVWILLTSRKTAPMDLGQLRSQGIAPESLSVIGVKAAVAHRQAYNPITKASFTVETPGPCSSNLSSLPFQKIARPIYPLDEF